MSDTNAATEPLTPRTARERALCRQAYMLGGFEVSSGYYDRVGDDVLKKLALAKYPDPPRELRKVKWLGITATYVALRYYVCGNTNPCSFADVASLTRAIGGVTDDVMRELLALRADPFIPVVEPAEPRKIGYAVMGPDGTVDAAFWTGSVERCFRAATAHYSSRKIRELLLGDEVPADD